MKFYSLFYKNNVFEYILLVTSALGLLYSSFNTIKRKKKVFFFYLHQDLFGFAENQYRAEIARKSKKLTLKISSLKGFISRSFLLHFRLLKHSIFYYEDVFSKILNKKTFDFLL
jgi:hypothetical protein